MAFFGVDAKEEEAGMLWVLGGLLAAIAVYLLLIASIVVFGIYGPEYDATPFIYFQF